MRVRDVISVAVDEAGRVFCADGSGLARVEDARLVGWGALPPRTRIASITARPGGGVLVVDVYENRVLAVDAAGELDAVAGRAQPATLDRRPARRDGPAAEARFRAPHVVTAAAGRVFCVELPPDPVVRRIEAGTVTTHELGHRAIGRIGAAAATADGSLLLADADAPCVFRLDAAGRLDVLAGRPDEAGDADGDGRDARFVRIAALTASDDGGAVVADGVRLRRLSPDGRVTSITAPRFEQIRAIATAPDGSIVVADGALWRVAPSGDVVQLAAETAPPPAGRATAKAFGAALVDGDAGAAWRIAEALLADHATSGRTRPDRTMHPVSVASARLGRELALAWAASEERDRGRVGAYCLWLIRSEEGLVAPPADAARLVGAVDRALDAGDLDRAVRAVEVVALAFGRLARRRDRLAVADAYRASLAAEAAPRLLSSADAPARDLGIAIAEQSRDVRFTPQLAALDGVPAALAALRAIWESPAYTAEQAEALRAGLRFGHGAVDRLFETYGDAALGVRGTARYRRVVAWPSAPPA